MKTARFVHVALWVGLLAAKPAVGQTITDLFDDGVLHEVRLEMSPADWQTLHDKYLENTYYRCTFRWRDVVLPNVGVRSRGSGSRNPIKPALALDFSRYDSAQRLVSLKTLVMRNFAQDPSMIRERLTEKLFARMGLPHSRESHAKLFVNDEYVGVYMLVEPIDKRFLATRFGEDTGYLYEFNFTGTPYHFEFLGDDPKLYTPEMFEPKTHEDAPEIERVIEMIRQINESPDAEFAATIDRYLDIDTYLAHAAVEQYVAEIDGLFGYGGMANFYLYRRMADNRFVFLIWDKDNAFAVADRSIWQNTPDSVLMRRLMEVPRFKQRFLEMVAHTGEAAIGWLDAEAAIAYEQIRAAVIADPYRVCLGDNGFIPCSIDMFERHAAFVRVVVSERPWRTLAEIRTSGFDLMENAPPLAPAMAVDLAAGQPVIASGELARIAVRTGISRNAVATGYPLPRELAGIRVYLRGDPAPLFAVSPYEVQFQVPYELPCGPQPLQIESNGARSHSIAVEVRPSVPALFGLTHGDGSLITGVNSPRPGEVVTLWITGAGQGATKLVSGEPAAMGTINPVKAPIRVELDGIPVKVLHAVMAPGWIGLQQIAIQMPDTLASGFHRLVLIAYEEPGPASTIWVR